MEISPCEAYNPRIVNTKLLFRGRVDVRRLLARYKLVLADSRVLRCFHGLFGPNTVPVKSGERCKTLDGFARIIRLLIDHEVKRFDTVALVGGGTLLDACGFALSVYKRGITFDSYPTTLLGMVDASVGGKNSLNFGGKNIIGTFHNPRRVVINVAFLRSLDRNAFMFGLSEIIKVCLLRGRRAAMRILKLRDRILARDMSTLSRLVRGAVGYKLDIARKDPLDAGLRNILNYGHTIGHAIEAASGYSIPHGYAVAKGIAFETSLLYELGFISRDQLACTLRVLTSYGYDLSIDCGCVRYLKTDKKNKDEKICVCGPVWGKPR